MYVVKIDFQMSGVFATASASANVVCDSMTVAFTNTSNGTSFVWDFGDGSPIDTNANPTHLYADTGTFVVMLIAIDSGSCNVADTFYMNITVLPFPVVDLGNDTTICGPVNRLMDATFPNCTYLWSTGATTPTITATAPGIYWVTISNGACAATDTLSILAYQPPNVGSDTVVCTGQSLVLDAGNPGSTYQWSTGAQTQTITVNTSGVYWVDVTSGNCTFRDSIDIQVLSVQQPSMGPDTLICPGQQLTWNGSDPNATYTWSDGSTGASFTADSAGTYWVTASIGSCELSDTVVVAFLASVELGNTTSLCDVEQGVLLDAGNPGSQYLWSTGQTTQTIVVSEAGEYYVNVINTSNCLLVDTIVVIGELGGGTLYTPNTFTPNGNGNNDVFYCYGTGITEFHMQIYDRWGMLLFTSDDITIGWDGKFRGNIVQQDTYVVKIQYKTECGDMNLHKEIRHVNVLR
jgi:gliding motility-associated-like protein